jgi:hypothetical protein
MGALDMFLAKGVRFELLSDDQIRAQGALDDSLRAAIKAVKPKIINELQWREFESLLAIVAPAYRTPSHELDEIRAATRNDLGSAVIAYRLMASHIQTAERQ